MTKSQEEVNGEQKTTPAYIVENLLSDQAIFQNFFLLEPDRNFFLRLFRRTGSMNQIADRTLIGIGQLIGINRQIPSDGSDIARKRLRPAGYFSHDTDSLMAFPYHSHHRSG